MELAYQVCNIELAKRLHELGVKQESLFSYVDTYEGIILHYGEIFDRLKICSTFTVSELGEFLKKFEGVSGFKYKDKNTMRLSLSSNIEGLSLIHSYEAGFSQYSDVLYSVEYDTEANMRADMLIHLIENNLIKLPNRYNFKNTMEVPIYRDNFKNTI